jgi:hypothetical protein
MKRFTLVLDNQSIDYPPRNELPDVPIQNMILKRDDDGFDIEYWILIVNKYRTTMMHLKIIGLKISAFELKMLLANMINLVTLDLKVNFRYI